MKSAKYAVAVLIIAIGLVITNSIVLENIIRSYENIVKKIESDDIEKALSEIVSLYDKFKKDEKYINITVSHLDLTNIEEMFASAIGAARANDSTELEIAKSRLEDAFSHLGRLVGINLDSIL